MPTVAPAPSCCNGVRRTAAAFVRRAGGSDDVMPFLENVTRGRGIPRERLESVAEHYLHFGGVSPINAINRALIDEIRVELAQRGDDLPVYFGNRNWDPFAEDTVAAMAADGSRGQRFSARRPGVAIRDVRSTRRTSPGPVPR